jgi:hypothetical protein
VRLSALRYVVAALGFGACSSYSGAPAAADAGSSADATTPQSVLYVSQASGNDSNEGLSQSKPLKSLRGAMALLEAKRLLGYEIRVCQGDYEEADLRITSAVTIRGSYNCVTWSRSDSFGKKGGFNDGNATRILRSAASTSPSTLDVEASGDVTLDGLVVNGGQGVSPFGSALSVKAGSLFLRDVLAAGAVGNAPGFTRGLVATSARVTIADSEFRGGAGATLAENDFASAAMTLDACSGTVSNSTL